MFLEQIPVRQTVRGIPNHLQVASQWPSFRALQTGSQTQSNWLVQGENHRRPWFSQSITYIYICYIYMDIIYIWWETYVCNCIYIKECITNYMYNYMYIWKGILDREREGIPVNFILCKYRNTLFAHHYAACHVKARKKHWLKRCRSMRLYNSCN
jgi:hypothetical protein